MQIWLGSHHLRTRGHGWLRLLVAAVLALGLALGTGPAAGASGKACRVRNLDRSQTYERLQ